MHVSGSSNSSFDAYSFASHISKMAMLGLVLGGTAALVKHVYDRYWNNSDQDNQKREQQFISGAQIRTGNINCAKGVSMMAIDRNGNAALVKHLLESRGKAMPESDEITVCFKCGIFEAFTSYDAKWTVAANKMILSFPKLNQECHIAGNGIFKLIFENGKPILTRTSDHCTKNFKKEETT